MCTGFPSVRTKRNGKGISTINDKVIPRISSQQVGKRLNPSGKLQVSSTEEEYSATVAAGNVASAKTR